jgi:hypothetical protein
MLLSSQSNCMKLYGLYCYLDVVHARQRRPLARMSCRLCFMLGRMSEFVHFLRFGRFVVDTVVWISVSHQWSADHKFSSGSALVVLLD